MTELSDIYEDRLPRLRRAEDRLRALLEEVVATIEDKSLVRAEVRSVRAKDLTSIERKARKTAGR